MNKRVLARKTIEQLKIFFTKRCLRKVTTFQQLLLITLEVTDEKQEDRVNNCIEKLRRGQKTFSNDDNVRFNRGHGKFINRQQLKVFY